MRYLGVQYTANVAQDTRSFNDFPTVDAWRDAIYAATDPSANVRLAVLRGDMEVPIPPTDNDDPLDLMAVGEDWTVAQWAEFLSEWAVKRYSEEEAVNVLQELPLETIAAVDAALAAVNAARQAEFDRQDHCVLSGAMDPEPAVFCIPGRYGLLKYGA